MRGVTVLRPWSNESNNSPNTTQQLGEILHIFRIQKQLLYVTLHDDSGDSTEGQGPRLPEIFFASSAVPSLLWEGIKFCIWNKCLTAYNRESGIYTRNEHDSSRLLLYSD